jgi:hypothetical protein
MGKAWSYPREGFRYDWGWRMKSVSRAFNRLTHIRSRKPYHA